MDHDKPDEAIPCSNGCGFFGRAATGGMCSKCYKGQAKPEASATESSQRVSLPVSASVELRKEVVVDTAPSPVAALVPPVTEPSPVNQAPRPTIDRSRCAECKKKVGLTGIECRCGQVYCGAHRMAEKHACTFDFKSFGRQNIEKANEKVVAQSLGEKL